MAKRFTATDKWRKQFMKGLSTVHKLLWLYILDDCDHAGIWDVELDIASIRIGEDVTGIEPSEFGDKVIVVGPDNKWFIPDFIDYQYGQLNDKVNAHKSAINRLKSQLPVRTFNLLINSCSRVKDKDKDKDKVKDKDKEEVYRKFAHLSISTKQVAKLQQDLGMSIEDVNQLCDEVENYAKNKSYKSLYLTIRKWWKARQPKEVVTFQATDKEIDDARRMLRDGIDG